MGETRQDGAESGVTLELTIPSNPDLTAEVDRRIAELTTRTGFDQGSRGDIMIAVNEAVKNAILHGNRCDESKQVVISCKCSSALFRIHICDCGSGFDPDALPDPRNPDNLLKENGRGILMIKALMDEVEFDITENGTSVTLIKYGH